MGYCRIVALTVEPAGKASFVQGRMQTRPMLNTRETDTLASFMWTFDNCEPRNYLGACERLITVRTAIRSQEGIKILLIIFKALHGINPLYLCELISPYQPRRALRSSDQLLLEQPAYKLKSYGSRAFSVCAPGLWNKLPLEIKSSTSVPEFKRRLKTHLFRQAFSF